jgi:hypothetical protein
VYIYQDEDLLKAVQGDKYDSDEARDARAEAKENEEWQGIDAWAYYGGWGLKRLIKDMRELEETGGRAGKANGPATGGVRNNSQLNRLL